MSMRSWTAEGFGVLAEDVDVADIKKKVEFVKKYLPDLYDELMEAMDAEHFVDEADEDYFCQCYLDDYEDDNCNTGFGAVLADVINKYLEELGLEDTLVDWVSVEYYG